MSSKEIAYVEERLRAIDRDNTFRMGQLALQVKNDVTEIRSRLEKLEIGLGELRQALMQEQPSERLNG